MNSEDSRNLILAIVLSAIVLIGWSYLFPQKTRPTPPIAPVATGTANPANPSANNATAPGGAAPAQVAAVPRADALAASPRVTIDAPGIGGSINLDGGEIDDVFLKAYRETIDPKSPNVVLFSPATSAEPYWAETGFVTPDKAVKTPNRTTRWSSSGGDLTPAHPITLTWDNGEGLIFTREIAIDDKYMFTVNDKIENKGTASVSVRPYGLIRRVGTPKVSGYSVLHEGFLGVIGDSSVQEVTYAGIEKETDKVKQLKGAGGWLGFTDKYWASALIAPTTEQVDARFSASGAQPREDYQSDFVAAALDVAPGATAANTTHIFAGAKEVGTIDAYGAALGIRKFDLMIDWGWFYFITKPLYYLIDFIYRYVGNFGLAILCVTVIVKGVLFPLANTSYRSMARMKLLQPKLAALKEQFPNDPQKQQQAQMELMKKEGVNPVAGCLPMLVQIPVFFALYKVIFITIEMRHAPFFGWIKDLSAPDPTNIFNLFGLIPVDPTTVPIFGHFLALGIWPLIMGFTMFLQMKMQPEPTDPTQKMMFTYMPFIFTFMFGSFPAGLVIYYAWNNSLTVLQQSLIMKRAGNRVELFDNLRKMFFKPAA
jgi:YidC/Oxa1 family membrane protein insertase